MTCPACLAAGMRPPDSAHPRRCAFEADEFSGDNWMCATLNRLRDRALWRNRDDGTNGTIAVIPLPDDEQEPHGYIVLGFYKARGTVGSTVVVSDDSTQPLTLEIAERMIG